MSRWTAVIHSSYDTFSNLLACNNEAGYFICKGRLARGGSVYEITLGSINYILSWRE